MSDQVTSFCHCGAVELVLKMHNGFEELRRCNCSICSKKGSVVASIAIENLEITKGHDLLTEYSFCTHTAKHYFCSICGIYTHHRRRSKPHQYGINLSSINGVNIEDYLHVEYTEGKGFLMMKPGN
jgi:hypothetical protein